MNDSMIECIYQLKLISCEVTKMFKVTNSNAKLGTISAINVPAIITCREDAPCTSICYACHGNFNYPSVKKCYENNLKSFMENQTQTEKDIIKQLTKTKYVRVHASGDFVNMAYLKMIVNIAKTLPMVKFMTYTKKYELVNTYIASGNKIPKNLKIIFSIWENFPMDNPYNMPTAFTELKTGSSDNRKLEKTISCLNDCDACYKCWNIKNGQQVLFHQHR